MAAQTLIDRRTAEIEAQVGGGELAEGMYLTYLLSSDKLTRAEVYISVTELLLGGVDTVSSSSDWWSSFWFLNTTQPLI